MPEPLPVPSDADLARYLSGAANQAEAQAIERWLRAAPEHQQRLDDLCLVLEATEPVSITWDPEAAWQQLADRLEPVQRPEVVRRAPTAGLHSFGLLTHTPRWLTRGLAAAGVAALALMGWYAERAVRTPTHPAMASLSVRRTGRGERVSFRLADGTGVMLGPVSQLTYPAEFGHGRREVQLEGDGYFEVVHDASRRFVVRAKSAQVRDLGTRFAIRARADDQAINVVVAEGSVAVRRGTSSDSIVLTRGDFARVARAGDPVVRRNVDVARYLGWTEGQLTFDREPLTTVVEELQRWYDADIRLASGDLKTRLLTATFRDKPLPDVLALIAASLDLTVSHTGTDFVLSDRQGNPHLLSR